MYIVDSVFCLSCFRNRLKPENNSHRGAHHKKHENGLQMMQNLGGSSIDNFVRVAYQLIVEVTWEVSH